MDVPDLKQVRLARLLYQMKGLRRVRERCKKKKRKDITNEDKWAITIHWILYSVQILASVLLVGKKLVPSHFVIRDYHR